MSAATRDPAWVRWTLIAVTAAFFLVFLFLPLALVFQQAFQKGIAGFAAAWSDPAAYNALLLTITTALIAVPLNALFGIAAAWFITKFTFRGKSVLISVLDLPFAVSPVISGLIFVLLLGARTPLGGWLVDHGFKVIFAPPGIVIATIFVTFPFVVRELIPLMQAQGREEEEAALTLGARGRQLFWRVTLPNIKWGLLYGMVLCNARAIGEFGAVSVVSGHIRGETNTIPLHVEILYSSYDFTASFAVASILVFLALVTLAVKAWLEHQFEKQDKGETP